MGILKINNLSFHNRGPVNLTVQPAECVCISGKSGAGKTLFLRTIIDFEPHDGTVLYDDLDAQTIPAPQWRKIAGLLPTESSWWFDTVGKHFNTYDEKLFSLLGFNRDVMAWQINRLSSGERQRLALMRLLLLKPKVLLLDEPTGNLNENNVKDVEKVIIQFKDRYQVPVIWISHSPDQIARVADRSFSFENGRLIDSQTKTKEN